MILIPERVSGRLVTMKFYFMLLAFVLVCLYPVVGNSAQDEGSGHYMEYDYIYKKGNGIIAAIFTPPLKRDDAVVVGAMFEMVNRVYGKHQIEDLKPTVVNEKGRNLIKFKGVGYDYFFLVMKQETGEVFGLSMWRKKR